MHQAAVVLLDECTAWTAMTSHRRSWDAFLVVEDPLPQLVQFLQYQITVNWIACWGYEECNSYKTISLVHGHVKLLLFVSVLIMESSTP